MTITKHDRPLPGAPHSAFRAVIGACLAAVAFGAAAADYPTSPSVCSSLSRPGGGADTLARIITPKLSEAMGQQWVVDNRAGAAGNISAETVRARRLTVTRRSWVFRRCSRSIRPCTSFPFDPARDLAPVTLLATAQYLLVVHPSVAAGSVKELVALAKQKPNALNFASAGVGSPLHLAGELFQHRAGVRLTHMPYKGGGPAAAAVLAGEAQMIFGSVASSLPQVKAGKLKALATTGLKRSKVAPEVPDDGRVRIPGLRSDELVRLPRPGGNARGNRQPHPRRSRTRAAAARRGRR